MDITYAIMS